MSIISLASVTRRSRAEAVVGSGDNYYDTLAALGTFRIGHKLDSSDSVTAWVGTNKNIEYDATEGAARTTFYPSTRTDKWPTPSGGNLTGSLTPDLPVSEYLNINEQTGPVLIIWDQKFHESWLPTAQSGGQVRSPVWNYKAMHCEGEESDGGNVALFWELRFVLRDDLAAGYFAKVNIRGNSDNNQWETTGCTDQDPYEPTGENAEPVSAIELPVNTQLRFIQYWELNIPDTDSRFDSWKAHISPATMDAGTYHRFSQWVYIGSTLYQMYDRVAVSRYRTAAATLTGIDRMHFEWDTSSEHTNASGVLAFTGTDGGFIPSGTKLHRVSDDLEYETTANATISGGVATATARPQDTSPIQKGDVGNCADGTEFYFESGAPANVDSAVFASGAFTGGLDRYAGDMYFWTRYFLALCGRTLPATPTDDTLVFQPPV